MAKNQHKKILFVITKANWGGAQKYVFDLASEFAKSDFDIVIACSKSTCELSQKLKNTKIRTIEIKNLQRDISIWKEFRVFISLWRIFRQEKPDIVHLNSSKIGGLGVLAGRLTGAPKIIFTAHGWAFNEKRPFWQIKLIKFLSWLTIILSHKTIVLSDKELQQISNWAFTNKKLIRIYNGIRPIDFLERTEAREFLNKKSEQISDVRCPSIDGHRMSEICSNNNFIIGTIAELHKNKGLANAIEAIGKLKTSNLKFLIISAGEERENLENLIEKKGLKNSVFLLGDIKNASRYLKAFDIFILPSIKEGFPFVLLEAGSAGLPVIATKIGGIPEIIDNMNSGILVEPDNTEKLTNALKVLIENNETREEFGKNLQEKIKNNFSFEKMFNETLKIYLK